MIIRTYFDKSNTIVKNSNVNTGLNPVTELFYGGTDGGEEYTRFLFHFDETKLKSLYSGGTTPNLGSFKHTLKMTNTGSFNTDLINNPIGSKNRTTSFDLITFRIGQLWDNGGGYDYSPPIMVYGDGAYSNRSSNWVSARTGISWSGGTGVYSGSSSGVTVSTQHFDKGNENIEMDVTSYVNGLLTGNTNYGLGVAYARPYEQLVISPPQYVGFYTNNTQTFYEPYIETTYSSHINDDRNDFYLDKPNKLYLYVNLLGNPTNLDNLPSVNVYDQTDALFSAYTTSAVTHETLGVYSIDLTVPTNPNNDCTMYTDVWSGINIGGVSRPDITLEFAMKNSLGFFNIGDSESTPKKVAISIGGLQSNENIKRGDIRKVMVSARIPYTVEQTQSVDGIQYRLYVKEGVNELTVMDFHPVERTSNGYYFLIDTDSLIPNTYYLDLKVSTNLEVTTIKEKINFNIVNNSNLRNSQ